MTSAPPLGMITRNPPDRGAREATRARARPVLAQMVLSALIEAALLIAHAEDPQAERNRTQRRGIP